LQDLRKGRREPALLSSDGGPTLARIDPEVDSMAATNEAEELLLIEEADAWFEYLEATREQSEVRYQEVEPWAWARLSQRLRAVNARKARLRPAAAA
jgi:hypothetical protein